MPLDTYELAKSFQVPLIHYQTFRI